jgi:hypothetical protein
MQSCRGQQMTHFGPKSPKENLQRWVSNNHMKGVYNPNHTQLKLYEWHCSELFLHSILSTFK